MAGDFGDDEEGIVRDALRLPRTAEEVRNMDLLREAREVVLDLKGGAGTDKGWGDCGAGYTHKEVLIAGLLLLLEEKDEELISVKLESVLRRFHTAVQRHLGGQLF